MRARHASGTGGLTTGSRLLDATAALASGLAAAAFFALALAGPFVGRPLDAAPVVATASNVAGTVQARPAQTLGWRQVVRGQEVRDGDAVFVAPGAAAALAFGDGSTLELDERSLVVVEAERAAARTVRLKQGSVSGVTGNAGLALLTPSGVAELAPASEVVVDVSGSSLEIAVRRGAARVQAGSTGTRSLEGGQRARVERGGPVVELQAWSVRLLEPKPNLRRRADDDKPLRFAWSGARLEGARLQVARDRLFAFVVVERDASGGEVELSLGQPGVAWWRVVEATGAPLSEARRFISVEGSAPQLVAPLEGETLLAPEGASVVFTWTPRVGAERYLLEVSDTREFEAIVETAVATGAGVRWTPKVPEGWWYWRVTADDGDPLGGLPSQIRKFRLIRKALPTAPELYSPEVELD